MQSIALNGLILSQQPIDSIVNQLLAMENNFSRRSFMTTAETNQNVRDDTHREPLILHNNWEKPQSIQVISERGGQGSGNKRLHDKIFKNPEAADPYKYVTGIRNGVLSAPIGVAPRNSIHSKNLVKIADLTRIKPSPNRA